MRLKFSPRRAALTLGALAIAGCAGHIEPTTAGSGLLPALSRVAAFSALNPAAVKVTGSYEGSVKKTESGHSKTGKITFIIKQKKKKIAGSCELVFTSGTRDFKLSGKVTSLSQTKAILAFTIIDPIAGRDAKATATVKATTLVGKATVPPSGSNPGYSFTFNTKRK